MGLTFPYELASAAYIAGVSEGGTRLFVHTINSKSEAQPYFDAGITGIYTDSITP